MKGSFSWVGLASLTRAASEPSAETAEERETRLRALNPKWLADYAAFDESLRRRDGRFDIRKAHALFVDLAGELLSQRRFWPLLVDEKFGPPIDWCQILFPFELPGRGGKADGEALKIALRLWQTVNLRWQLAYPNTYWDYVSEVLGEQLIWLDSVERVIRRYWEIPRDGRLDWSPEERVARRRLRPLIPREKRIDLEAIMKESQQELQLEKLSNARSPEEAFQPIEQRELTQRFSEKIVRLEGDLIEKHSTPELQAEWEKILERIGPPKPRTQRYWGGKGGRGHVGPGKAPKYHVYDAALRWSWTNESWLWRRHSNEMDIQKIIVRVRAAFNLKVGEKAVYAFARRQDRAAMSGQ
ncbi:MAG: hypothetical protein WBG19_05475 [Thermoplasmata archaeon]